MAEDNASDSEFYLSKLSMFDEVEKVAKMQPERPAYFFYGRTVTYGKFIKDIELCAKSLKAIGVKKGDAVTIMLPNCPQAVNFVYAVNMIGGIANMLHPLSSERDVEVSLEITGSKYAITLDTFAQIYVNLQPKLKMERVIVTYIQDCMGTVQGLLYPFVSHTKKIKFEQPFISTWKSFLNVGKNYSGAYREKVEAEDPAIIIHTGGTTGTPKGALHCNRAFNALAKQIGPVCGITKEDRVLTIIPVFHGFGLGVSVHSVLVNGACSYLLPRYFPEEYAKMTVKHKITYHIGTPSLFESQLHTETLKGADLSFIRGLFSGGDYMTDEAKTRIRNFLREHKSECYPRQGYGLAEVIGAVLLEPTIPDKPCSIGYPFPGISVKIVNPGTDEELPVGEMGEICLCGPNMMMKYLNNPVETENVIKTHTDGNVWVHSGDLGRVDADGAVYFTQRLKRMIVTNGYNVYPSQLEEIFDSHEAVRVSCVIGVPDERKGQKIMVYAVLQDPNADQDAIRQELMDYARKNVPKYAKPAAIEFRESLPLTMLGKVNFRELEQEYANKNQ